MDDLMAFVDLEQTPNAEGPVKALGTQVLDAAVATKPTEAAVAPLLEHLYVAIKARQLSEGQVKTLEGDVPGRRVPDGARRREGAGACLAGGNRPAGGDRSSPPLVRGFLATNYQLPTTNYQLPTGAGLECF